MCGSKKSAPAPQVVYVPEPVYIPKAPEPTPAPAAVSDPSASRDRRRSTRRATGALLSSPGVSALTSTATATPGRAGLG